MALGRMRVLFVTDQLVIGGAERQLIEMCRLFNRDGFELYVFTTVSGGHLQDQFEELGVVVHANDHKFKPGVVTAVRLAKFIVDRRIDIVHSWLWYSTAICYLATRLTRRARWIATVHGVPLGFGKRHEYVERLAYRAVDRITTISQYNYHLLVDAHQVSAKATVIYNGIDSTIGLPEGKRGVSPRERRGAVIGCIANFGKEKGHGFLVEAIALITDEVPDLKLLLVGDGPLRPQIEKAIADQGLEDHILLLGQRDDVPEILAGLDFTVLSSLSEGMPVSIMEAMVAHLPVVATDVGGISEIVVDGETGLLVEPENPRQLAAAMMRLLVNPQRRAEMGEMAYRRVAEVFAIGRTVESYEKLYAELYRKRDESAPD
jgi:glycosyltransferase involved in cell wall biosynthesis